MFGALGLASAAPPFPTPPKGGLPACKADLFACETELTACDEELAACQEKPDLVLPGDGWLEDAYPSGGVPLRYTDNGNGTFTDDNTGLMWEIKDGNDGVADYANPHDVDNTYTWAPLGEAEPLGTAFTEFLFTLNAGGGFASYTDWRLPTVKELQTLVDYSVGEPGPAVSASLPGATATDPSEVPGLPTGSAYYYSTTNSAFDQWGLSVWIVDFWRGSVNAFGKANNYRVRAVRGGQ